MATTGAVGLSLSGATKTYGSVRALDRLRLEVPEGCFFVLFGPSSVGKTTTLRATSALVPLDSGTIHIGGRDVTNAPIRGRGVSMVFQSFALYPHLSAFKNLAYPLVEDRRPCKQPLAAVSAGNHVAIASRGSVIVALAFFVVMLISIVAAYLYGVFFVNAVAPDTSEPFYRQPFVWSVAAMAVALAALLRSLLRR